MEKPEYAEILIRLAKKDLSVREKLLRENQLGGGYHPEMEKIHRKNAESLRNIIKDIGFPGISKVGEEANEAAWLIVQHSIAEPKFMMAFYGLMKENEMDINKKHLAYLYDRIQYFQGKPQRFGTQLNADGSIYPVIDKEQLNTLRVEYDLPIISSDDLNRIARVEDIERIENENHNYMTWRDGVGWKSI
ncbi:DUF6624 domain-containing protein [Chryseobacterium sp. PET-29]|uniref:DUF6624 domain-containing protein n=1 Tax=Chryseobacterium sp. PET-29 TaxID=2983267 RepID=UPI0021E61B19|nr:DUF6624 domain-containing protein [Chryseobacterium sp. PET-29]